MGQDFLDKLYKLYDIHAEKQLIAYPWQDGNNHILYAMFYNKPEVM